MSRLQLALRVGDLDAAVAFYETFFDTPVHKRRDGYANFSIDEPPLKLVLFAAEGVDAAEVDHLGVEVDTTEEVGAAVTRLTAAGMTPEVREKTLCCHAVQDKLLVDGGDGHQWEVYVVTDDLLATT
jgi:catechol 2,3-dioxygenase-like lactoylglutathione lyase family enzyme